MAVLHTFLYVVNCNGLTTTVLLSRLEFYIFRYLLYGDLLFVCLSVCFFFLLFFLLFFFVCLLVCLFVCLWCYNVMCNVLLAAANLLLQCECCFKIIKKHVWLYFPLDAAKKKRDTLRHHIGLHKSLKSRSDHVVTTTIWSL